VQTNKFKSKFLAGVAAIAFGIALAASIKPAQAGIQSQLDSMFNSMTNVTPPGVFETQRRGVISGGRVTVKNKLFNENLINLTPPSWRGGCGGLDFFGGSFSFINSEQLTQLLRAVAANAISYAFTLALKNMCEACANILETLQKKIQQLNQFMGDSCQLAQGIVNDTIAAIDTQNKVEHKTEASASGFLTDWFEGWGEAKGTSATKEIHQNNPEALKTGNIVWRQMKRSQTAAWFNVQGNNELLEAILSLTGSVVVHPPGQQDASEDTQTITEIPGNKINMTELIEGGPVSIYSCSSDTDKCMNPSTKSITLTGLKTRIENVLLGPTNQQGDGLVGKYAHNTGSFSTTEAAISSNLDLGLGAMLFNLATLSEPTARQFVQQFSGAIATNMAYTVALESLRAAEAALGGEDSVYVSKVHDTITRSRRNIESEYSALQNKYGKIGEAINMYNNIIVNVRQSQYAPARRKTSSK